MKFLFPHRCTVILAIICLLFLATCKQGDAPSQETEKPPAEKGCLNCHAFTLDANHDIVCTACHLGNDEASSNQLAHEGLIANPASPSTMMQYCGSCHESPVRDSALSLHFTLKNEVNMVRKAFGAPESLTSLIEIPLHENFETPLQLADDLLRRRCLRCHPYNEGDAYPETQRGTGCAACHLPYRNGKLTSHHFMKTPTDNECLHCHYGNYVGADFYGRYEHDFGAEYRTPYRTDDVFSRPYGVEYHQLQPDIHMLSGMTCVDCHSGHDLMNTTPQPNHTGTADTKKLTCWSCHDPQGFQSSSLPDNMTRENGEIFLTTRLSGKRLRVPALRHPAHKEAQQAACSVCHAQWTYFDKGTHLLRQDFVDYEQWQHLSVQGAFEIEDQLDFTDYEVPFMHDKITGTPAPGIWFKAFELRRWEIPIIKRDKDGILKVFRPILDLHLSYVNEEESVVLDNAGINKNISPYQPYTPHTTGKAGAFYKQRLKAAIGE